MKAFVRLVVAVTLTVPLVAQTVLKTKTKQKAPAATAEDIKALLLNARNGPTSLASGVKPGQTEPWLNRLQFDLIDTF
jgi:hypothetical protein